ncbi:MAG: T9SS C-terminal target domain-containing protein, partial [Salibacteraceae bacterium]
ALIQSGGDLWWDFNRARYEIPKESGKMSLFAGSLWLAGQDISGQFKVAALRFRQVGNDYWTGPLSTVDAEIDQQTCQDYDRHWETTRSMVAEFAAWFEAGVFDQENGTNTQDENYEGYTTPSVIQEWPAHGRNIEPYNEDYYLAPFFDRNGDGDYNPTDGDYPGYVLSGQSDCSRRVRDIYGDQNLWWIFNDKGNVHTESSGQAIGMEIRAQAFAFATTDEVNNMTFYNYELINRSTFELADTYFGQWVDGDLGNAQDDYVGVDVRRGLGYFYNGDDNDEDAQGQLGYGTNPPAIGVDFFQGPFQANDGIDNCLCVNDYAGAIADDGIVYSGQGAGYGDGIVDNERYGMRKFLYHNNAQGPQGDPNNATDYYNMLRGIWRDGTPMTYGGNGYDPANPNAIPAGYMFPGDTDPLGWGTEGLPQDAWTEVTAGNSPADRRFVQSSGPFRLGPGAVNNITVGVVWMQATQGGRLESVELMRKADDKTQALFDSCFEILDGPDSPDMAIQELDKEVILMITNPQNSNNFNEEYAIQDPFLAAPDSVDAGDGQMVALTLKEKRIYSTYKFEGYQIYQLADASVGTNDLEDPDKARLVAQVDIANDVEDLVNHEFDARIGQDVPQVKVEAENEGIRHTFKVERDLFATDENTRLVNHKTYYFMAIAYAYNRYGDGFGNLQYIDGVYDPASDRTEGQKVPYLASRKSPSGAVKVYEAIPHKTESEMGGVMLNAQYGDGIEITQVEGRGNGGNFVNIKEDYLDSVLTPASWETKTLTYQAGQGPVALKVVDPLVIPPGEFTIQFIDTTANGNSENYTWALYQRDSDTPIDTIRADQTVRQRNEQVMFELGLSLTVGPGYPANDENAVRNGFVGADIEFDDETDQWLAGLPDVDGNQTFNWIKSGDYFPEAQEEIGEDEYDAFLELTNTNATDPNQDFEDILGRTWAPFAVTSFDTAHPVPLYRVNNALQLILSK